METDKTLTEKQRAFCREYLVDFNATQAAVRAGYSKRSAKSIGNENLTKPDIQNYLTHLQVPALKSLGVTRDRILEEICIIAFSNIYNYINIDYETDQVNLDLQKADPRQLAAISDLDCADGYIHGRHMRRFKLNMHNKLKALEILAKHYGMVLNNGIDVNVRHTIDARQSISPQFYDEVAKQIAAIWKKDK